MKYLLTFLGVILTLPLRGAVKPDPIDQTESMLDRLEQKLLEQEASVLEIQAPKKNIRPTKANKIIHMPSTTFSGRIPDEADLSHIDTKIKAIEGHTEELSQRVEKLRSDIIEKSEKASFIEILIQLDAPDETAIQELSMSVDKHVLYKIGPDMNPWTPTPQIMIYSGPLEPGTHQVSLIARTVRRYGEKLPLDQNLYHMYSQDLKIEIPTGQFRKMYKIRLSKPEKQNTYAQAIMENYDIP